MKTVTLALSLGLFLATGNLFAADSPLLGDWKLDESRSRITPGTGKNMKVDYHDLLSERFKVEVHGIDATGKKIDAEWKGKFDGHDYAVEGDPSTDMRAVTQVDDRTLTVVNKKAGRVVSTAQIQVSPDGKTRTVTVRGRTAAGKKYKNIAVYNRD
jgi:hypothetical protein